MRPPAHTYLLEVWKGKFLQRNVQDLVVVIQNCTVNLLQVVELQESSLTAGEEKMTSF